MFSGGKDSLALVHLLEEYWDWLTILHINTGRLLPEINEVVESVKALVPNFHQIDTNVDKWQAENGLPTDIMPTSSTTVGIAFGMSNIKLVDRWTCCGANLWNPATKYILDNNVDVVIRGTKQCDSKRLPHNGGKTSEGYYLWLPLNEWSHAEVFAFLKARGTHLPRLYDYQINSPECATCPAWLSENRGAYLKEHYPALYAEYKWKLTLLADELVPLVDQLKAELLS